MYIPQLSDRVNSAPKRHFSRRYWGFVRGTVYIQLQKRPFFAFFADLFPLGVRYSERCTLISVAAFFAGTRGDVVEIVRSCAGRRAFAFAVQKWRLAACWLRCQGSGPVLRQAVGVIVEGKAAVV